MSRHNDELEQPLFSIPELNLFVPMIQQIRCIQYIQYTNMIQADKNHLPH